TCKPLLNGKRANCKHKGLVAVVTTTEIAVLKHFAHGNLRYFLAVAKNPEFGFACENFLSSQQTCLTAFVYQCIIVKHNAFKLFKTQIAFFSGCILFAHKGKYNRLREIREIFKQS